MAGKPAVQAGFRLWSKLKATSQAAACSATVHRTWIWDPAAGTRPGEGCRCRSLLPWKQGVASRILQPCLRLSTRLSLRIAAVKLPPCCPCQQERLLVVRSLPFSSRAVLLLCSILLPCRLCFCRGSPRWLQRQRCALLNCTAARQAAAAAGCHVGSLRQS